MFKRSLHIPLGVHCQSVQVKDSTCMLYNKHSVVTYYLSLGSSFSVPLDPTDDLNSIPGIHHRRKNNTPESCPMMWDSTLYAMNVLLSLVNKETL